MSEQLYDAYALPNTWIAHESLTDLECNGIQYNKHCSNKEKAYNTFLQVGELLKMD
jgi:hypothetical protein